MRPITPMPVLLLGPKFDFKDGLFSGYDPKTKKYDKSFWAFEKDENGVPKRDLTLKDPRCVFQLMKKHYSRYTPKTVSAITGTSEAELKKVYETYAKTGAVDKTGTIMYAMGWTQHTVGVQNIRMMAMIQLMLGNMGRPGGGVNALRGESNVQGSTDHCLLFHIWPGYLGTPDSVFGDTGRLQRQEYTKNKRSPLRQLVAEQAQVHGQLSESHVRGSRHQGERFRLFLDAQDSTTARPIRGWISLMKCTKETSRVSLPGARIRPVPAPIPIRPVRHWPSWTGWSTSTCSTMKPLRSGRDRE